MRTARGLGAKGLGGYPLGGPDSHRIACPVCQAEVGERCRVYKVNRGERLYIQGHRVKVHPERTAAQKGGA